MDHVVCGHSDHDSIKAFFRVLTGSQPYGRAGGETFHHCNILRTVQVADNKARPDEITTGDRAGLEFTAALVDTLPADNLSIFASVQVGQRNRHVCSRSTAPFCVVVTGHATNIASAEYVTNAFFHCVRPRPVLSWRMFPCTVERQPSEQSFLL